MEQNTSKDFDVMIVGGGPAGLSTWLHLHKIAPDLAFKTVLIEKEKYPRDKLCGGALGIWGQNILKDLGIFFNIPSIKIKNTEYRFGKEIYSKKEPGFLEIFSRMEFDFFLAKSAEEKGLQLNQNEKLQDIKRIKNALTIKTNKKDYCIKTLVGADGALSTVRRLIKFPDKLRLATGIELFSPVDPIHDSEFETKTAILDFTPMNEGLHGYIWHFPCVKENKPFMNHGIFDSRVNAGKLGTKIKKILRYDLRLRNINNLPYLWDGHPIPWMEKKSNLSQPNIIMVGDAAGIEPLLGGGIHLALSYGDLAAKAIVNAYHSNDFSYNTYSTDYQNHIVGRYINKLSHLAYKTYTGSMNVIDAIRKIFEK
jgi:flavin-dependent dehydrogenase